MVNFSIASITHEYLPFGFHYGKRVISLNTAIYRQGVYEKECSLETVSNIHKKVNNYYPSGIVVKPEIWHCDECDPAFQCNWDKFINFSEHAVHFHTNGARDISIMCDWLGVHLINGVKPKSENIKYACEIFVYADNEHQLDEFEEIIIEHNTGAHVWLVPATENGYTFCKQRVVELESPINYRLGIHENTLFTHRFSKSGGVDEESAQSQHPPTKANTVII